MSNPVIVVHYHELWLKGRNRRFFLGKLFTALRQSLQGIPVERIEQPGDRFIVRLGDGAPLAEAIKRLERIPGVAYYAVARPVERNMEALCSAAWDEIEPLRFRNVRGARQAQRQDVSAFDDGDREDRGAVPARQTARAWPRSTRALERSRPDVPRRGDAGAVAGLRAKNSGHGRPACEYRGAHDVPAFGRLRFGGGRLPHDEARSAPELRALLRHRRAAGRVVAAHRERPGADADAVSISLEALPRAV